MTDIPRDSSIPHCHGRLSKTTHPGEWWLHTQQHIGPCITTHQDAHCAHHHFAGQLRLRRPAATNLMRNPNVSSRKTRHFTLPQAASGSTHLGGMSTTSVRGTAHHHLQPECLKPAAHRAAGTCSWQDRPARMHTRPVGTTGVPPQEDAKDIHTQTLPDAMTSPSCHSITTARQHSPSTSPGNPSLAAWCHDGDSTTTTQQPPWPNHITAAHQPRAPTVTSSGGGEPPWTPSMKTPPPTLACMLMHKCHPLPHPVVMDDA